MAARGWIVISIACIGAVGCGPRPELVYVDFARIPAPTLPEPSSAPGPRFGSLPPVREELPNLPARTLYVGGAAQSAKAAVDAIRRNQEVALHELERRLLRQVATIVAEAEASRRAELETKYQAEIGEAFEAIRAAFDRFASAAGPKWRRLAFLVGFPDPDPKSKRQAKPGDKIEAARLAEAKRLRGEIAALEVEYRNEVSTLLGAAGDTLSRAIASLTTDLEDLRAQKEQEARQAARDIVEQSVAGLEQPLIDPQAMLWPSQGVKAVLPGTKAANSAPKPPSVSKDWTSQQWVRSEAHIFADLNGYRLGAKGQGRDVTKEFLEWRKRIKSGVFPN